LSLLGREVIDPDGDLDGSVGRLESSTTVISGCALHHHADLVGCQRHPGVVDDVAHEVGDTEAHGALNATDCHAQVDGNGDQC
jgi:hypothetical protein